MSKLASNLEKSNHDQAWTKLLTTSSSAPVIVKMADDGQSSKASPILSDPSSLTTERKQSIFGSFNRHLRMSLKAINDSPGHITR